MTNDELDPRELDRAGPGADPEGWERLVASITERAEPALASRRREAGLADVLAAWRRPVYSATTALAAAAIAALLLVPVVSGSDGEAMAETPPLVAEAILPTAWAAWLQADYSPTLTELVDGSSSEVP